MNKSNINELSAENEADSNSTAEIQHVSQPNANTNVGRSLKWHNFKAFTPRNRQKLPPFRKYVLVRVKNLDENFPDPVCVGYLKFHAGDKSAPFFVTPGCTINSPIGDESTVQWCDCLPDGFVWYNGVSL